MERWREMEVPGPAMKPNFGGGVHRAHEQGTRNAYIIEHDDRVFSRGERGEERDSSAVVALAELDEVCAGLEQRRWGLRGDAGAGTARRNTANTKPGLSPVGHGERAGLAQDGRAAGGGEGEQGRGMSTASVTQPRWQWGIARGHWWWWVVGGSGW